MSIKSPGTWSSWKVKDLQEIRHRVTQVGAKLLTDGGPEAVRRWAHERVAQLEQAGNDASLYELFECLLMLLDHAADYGPLRPAETRSILALAERLLDHQGIRPQTSRFAYLRADLAVRRARLAAATGRGREAAWELERACYLGGPAHGAAADPVMLMELGEAALRLGHCDRAAAAFTSAEALAGDAGLRGRCRLGRIKAARLGARGQEARLLLDPDIVDAEARWEEACLTACEEQDLSKLAALAGGQLLTPARQSIVLLWSLAIRSRRWQGLAKAPTVRRGQAAGPMLSPGEALGAAAAAVIARCQMTSVPFVRRLADIGRIVERAGDLGSVELELLVLAAAARWLMRHNQRGLGTLVLAEYRQRSLATSGGRSVDLFGCTADLFDAGRASGIPEQVE